MSQTNSPRISILGEGTSTFEGITLKAGSLYSERYLSYSGFGTVDGTWWMQLAKLMGGSILGNNSVQGSYVSYKGHYPITLNGRIRSLGNEEASPDLILVYSGINDVANDIPQDAFRQDYTEALTKLHKFFPDAQVWVGTIVTGDAPSPNRIVAYPPETLTHLDEYNQIIREVVEATGCNLADFAAQKLTFPTVDGYHPDAAGMTIWAHAWLDNIQGKK